MPYTSEPCRKASAILAAHAPAAPLPVQMTLASRVLLEIADECPHDGDGLTIIAPFVEEGASVVAEICGFSSEAAGPLHDMAFTLLECLAVFARMRHFCDGTRQIPPAQGELLRYFETCGEWSPGDGTLVSHYYYSLIPQWFKEK